MRRLWWIAFLIILVGLPGITALRASPAEIKGHGSTLSAPSGRSDFGLANDAAHGNVVLFGGRRGLDEATLGDTWIWDGTAWTEQHPATSPDPRCCFSMAYDPARGQVVLFGGWDLSEFFRDTWVWDGVTWTKLDTQHAPGSSSFLGMAFDAQRQELVLHGFQETWTWDGTDWTHEQPASSPSVRESPGMSREGGNVLLFGGGVGFEEDRTFRDTWRWDGADWTKLHPPLSPPRRMSMGLAYDQARRRVTLFGGDNLAGRGPFRDTWTWDGASWTKLFPATSPPSRASMGFVYDSTRREIVMFGGVTVVHGEVLYLADTWTWDGSTWTEH